MGPVAKPGQCKTQATTQRLGHCFKGAVWVAAPVYGEALAPCGGGACEKGGLVLAEILRKDLKRDLVVKEGVVVVHFLGAGSVVIDNIARGNPLTEVGLQGN